MVYTNLEQFASFTLSRRWCDVESMSITLIQRRHNVVCPVGRMVETTK